MIIKTNLKKVFGASSEEHVGLFKRLFNYYIYWFYFCTYMHAYLFIKVTFKLNVLICTSFTSFKILYTISSNLYIQGDREHPQSKPN